MRDLTRGRAATCVTCEQMLDGSRCTNPMCSGFVDESEVERLEQERDSLKAQVQEWMEGSAQLQVKLDEAERLLHLSKCIGQNPDSNADYYCWMHGGPAEEYCPRCTFLAELAGLSTVTPEDWAGHLRERAEGGGKTAAELREQYGLTPRCEFGCTVDKGGQHHPGCAEVVAVTPDPAREQYARRPDGLPYALPDTQEELGKQEAAILDGLGFKEPCKRVSVPVPCETCTLQHRYVERCATHGCDWPDGEKECPA